MIKPVAYTIEQFGMVAFYTTKEFFLLPLTSEMLAKGDAKPLYAIPEGHSITEDKASWEVKKLLALAWEAIQEAGYEDHSFELRDKIDQYLDEAGGVK